MKKANCQNCYLIHYDYYRIRDARHWCVLCQNGCTKCASVRTDLLILKMVFFAVTPTDALISKFILVRNSTYFGQFSAHHQEFSTVHSALAHVIHV